MTKYPMMFVSPTIETNETKYDPRVPYDIDTWMVWNFYDEMPWTKSMWKSISQKVSHIGNWNTALQIWIQTTEAWFAFSNQQSNYSKWDETKQFQDPIAGITPFQTTWVQNIDHEST